MHAPGRSRMVFVAVLAIGATAEQAATPKLPLVTPSITTLGTIEDPSPAGDQLPREAALSPDGHLIAYMTGAVPYGDMQIWNVDSRTHGPVLSTSTHDYRWGTGDTLVLTRFDSKAFKNRVWTIRIDPHTGGAVAPLFPVSPSGASHVAALSPDGRWIAFSRSMASDSSRSELALIAATGGPERVLASSFDLGVKGFVRDGSAILYTGHPSLSGVKQSFRVPVAGGPSVLLATGPAGDSADSVWVYRDPDDGHPLARLALPADISVADWSGSNHLAGIHSSYPRGLRVVRVADGEVRQLVDAAGELGRPAWFADGKRLAVVVRRNGKLTLLKLRADGGSSQSFDFTTPPFFDSVRGPADSQLQISPDGRFAVFLGEGHDTIEVIDLTSRRQRRLARITMLSPDTGGVDIGSLTWTADSKHIRYVAGTYVSGTGAAHAIHEVDFSGHDRVVRPVPAWQTPGHFPVLPAHGTSSRTGESIAEVFGPTGVSVLPLKDGPARDVFKGPVFGSGILSPDGRTLALRARPTSGGARTQRVTLVSLSDSTARDITLPFLEIPNMSWHPDGRRFFMSGRERTGDPVNIYEVPADGAPVRLLGPVGSIREEGVLTVSPDGVFIAYTVAERPSATFVRLDFNVPGAR